MKTTNKMTAHVWSEYINPETFEARENETPEAFEQRVRNIAASRFNGSYEIVAGAALKKYYNTLAEYGAEGPFEAESKEALADGMRDCFEAWAKDKLGQADDVEDAAAFIERQMEDMRAEFINGLEEI